MVFPLKNRHSQVSVCLYAAGLFILLSPTISYAYLDPSAGGWLYQMLFPLFVAVSGTVAVGWQRLMLLLKRLRLVVPNQSRSAEDPSQHPFSWVRLLLMLPAVCVGIVMPVQFMANANNFLGYLRALELVPVFGWSWLLTASGALLTGGVILLGCLILAKCCRKSPITIAVPVILCLSLVLVSWWLFKGVLLWCTTMGLPFAETLAHGEKVSIWVFLAACPLILWKFEERVVAVISYTEMLAKAGLLVTLLAPAAGWYANPERQLPKLPAASAVPGQRPDIVLITTDAMSAAHMSLYGYQRPTTPNLETFAAEADVYDRFYASSNFTTSAVSSLLHGVRPWTHRALQLPARPLPAVAGRGLIAQLKSAGYRTFAVTTNLDAAPFHNLTRPCFDTIISGRVNQFAGLLGPIVARFPHLLPVFTLVPFEDLCDVIDKVLVKSGFYDSTNHYDPEKVFAPARHILAGHKENRPFFLWVHLYSPHSPYAAPAPFLGKFDSSPSHRTRGDSTPPWLYQAGADSSFPLEYAGRYDEAIANTDMHIGEFLSWLKGRKLYDKSLVIVSADHGESFTHGYGAHSGPALYEDLIHIPLVIKAPLQRTGTRQSGLAEQIDLLPTIMHYVGTKTLPGGEGVAINPGSGSPEGNRTVFSMNFQQNYCWGELLTGTIAIVRGDWKLIHYLGGNEYPFMPRLTDELYNLRADPGETVNLIGSNSALAGQLLAEINRQLQAHGGFLE